MSNSKDFSFGYSYFPNESLITDLALRVNTLLSQSDIYSKRYYRGVPLNEMRILGIINKETEKTDAKLKILTTFSSK